MRDGATMWPPKPAVMQAIPVTAVHDFLTRHGWVQKPSPRPTSRYYELRDTTLHYFFPVADHFADYPLLVLNFVENFARFYDLDPHAILAELQGGAVAEAVRSSVPA